MASNQSSLAGGTPLGVGWAAETLIPVPVPPVPLGKARPRALCVPSKAQTPHSPGKPWTLHNYSSSSGHKPCLCLCGTGGDHAGSSLHQTPFWGEITAAFLLLAGKGGLARQDHPIAASDPSCAVPGDERGHWDAPKGLASPNVPSGAPQRLCPHAGNPHLKGGFLGPNLAPNQPWEVTNQESHGLNPSLATSTVSPCTRESSPGVPLP